MLMLRTLGIFVFLLLVWQLLILIFKLPIYILPSPLEVATALVNNGPLLFENSIPTIVEIVLGLIFGVALGMSLALLMVNLRLLRYWLLPLIVISQALPTFAFAPLLINWFGYGMASKIATIMLMLFFPVASAFYDGLRKTPLDWLDMGQIMNGNKLTILWQLRFPAALPNLATGIRLATALAPIGAIISEWIGASHGLGFLMLNANARLDTSLMFAAIFIIMIISLLLYTTIDVALLKSHFEKASLQN